MLELSDDWLELVGRACVLELDDALDRDEPELLVDMACVLELDDDPDELELVVITSVLDDADELDELDSNSGSEPSATYRDPETLHATPMT